MLHLHSQLTSADKGEQKHNPAYQPRHVQNDRVTTGIGSHTKTLNERCPNHSIVVESGTRVDLTNFRTPNGSTHTPDYLIFSL